jgi:uncharacterized membrane protein YhiD involved in acid resistance
MPEWLKTPSTPVPDLPHATLLFQLLAAIVLGGAVAAIYRMSHGRESSNSHAMSTTLVLLSALIAMVSIVIGDSVARAFSLVGALSIVRFRTVVDDTRDTAFVIFAVIVGMAAGAGLVLQAAIAIPLIGVTAIVLSRLSSPTSSASGSCTLTVRIALGRDPQSCLADVLERHFLFATPVVTSTARQGSVLELTYDAKLRTPEQAVAAVRDLNQTEGVMNVELRRT